jgi:acetyl-CoA acetyltransferase
MTTPPSYDRIPVMIACGESVDRTRDPGSGLEPLALMAKAVEALEDDAGVRLRDEIDWISIIGLASWRYRDPVGELAAFIGLTNAPQGRYWPMGGETPVSALLEASRRIAAGDDAVTLICGAESQYTASRARRAGIELPWTPFARDAGGLERAVSYINPLAVRHGVIMPVTVYPFYEAGSAASWGQTPAQASEESAVLWSRYAAAAATNPSSWITTPYSPEEIRQPSADNRMIAWPYPKRMVANPNVNQGAAVVVTSLAKARSLGIREERMAFIIGGAAAAEPRDWLLRDGYASSTAQTVVLWRAQALCESNGSAPQALELYSCFPCVPKMARRTLGFGPDVAPTVTGGLSFFGAPLNNYMTHAACAMLRRLRNGAMNGLLYGQGEFVTKHCALVLSRQPAGYEALARPDTSQQEVRTAYGQVPAIVEREGDATIETFTVLYDEEGRAQRGMLIVRFTDGARSLVRTPSGADDDLMRLTSAERFPIGDRGEVSKGADGLGEWSFS